MQFEPTRWYRVQPIAEALDVSVATIYRAVETGELPAARIGRGKGAIRVRGDAAASYVEACERAAATSPRQRKPQTSTFCVICGINLDASPVGRYPVGWTNAGAQVYACDLHREAVTTSTGGAA